MQSFGNQLGSTFGKLHYVKSIDAESFWDAKKVRWGRRRDVPTLMDADGRWRYLWCEKDAIGRWDVGLNFGRKSDAL